MALWTCRKCTTQFAVGLPHCPHCTGTDIEKDEDGMPKNTVHGGTSNIDLPDDPANAAGAVRPELEEQVEEAVKQPTISELRVELRERGLKTSGNKEELQERLAADDQAKAEAAGQGLGDETEAEATAGADNSADDG
jgi:hypothetical protein